MGNVLNFWPSCLLLTCTMYTPLYPIGALIRMLLSRQLLRNLRFEPNVFTGFFLSLFCFPCEVGRESLEVDDEESVIVTCPFTVRSTWQEREAASKKERGCLGLLCTTSEGRKFGLQVEPLDN